MLTPLPIDPLAQKSLRYWYQLSDTCGAIACSIISSSTKIWTGQPETTEKGKKQPFSVVSTTQLYEFLLFRVY
jgi:hypothetical protein